MTKFNPTKHSENIYKGWVKAISTLARETLGEYLNGVSDEEIFGIFVKTMGDKIRIRPFGWDSKIS